MPELSDSVPLSLYVHVPWCVKKCPYCDFNSHALKAELPERGYIDALLADLESETGNVETRPVESVFIGGGTPSLLSPDSVSRLIVGIRERVELKPGCEITLEANPGTAEANRFRAYRHAGVNRLSIGVQSFDDRLLAAIGRIHDGREARAAAEMAMAANFDSVNLDLMYALPGQSEAQAMADIDQALELDPAHLSYYQLTLEPNTLFYRNPPKLPSDDDAWRIFQRSLERIQDRGYVRYEVSAFARPGFECRHNLNYWRFGDYIGIGAGAHGKITDPARGRILRALKHRHPRAYLESARSRRFEMKREAIARESLPLEFMMNAMRLVDGFDLSLFSQRSGLDLGKISHALLKAESKNLIEITNDWLKPTPLGLQFLNDLLMLFATSAQVRETVNASPCVPSGDGLLSVGNR